MKKILFPFALCFIQIASGFSQGTVDDYKRAFDLHDKYKDKVFYSNVSPQWTDRADTFWYIRYTPEGDEYTLVDAKKKTRKPLFDHQNLADALAQATSEKVDASHLWLKNVKISTKADSLYFEFNGKKWFYSIQTNALSEKEEVKKTKYEYWGNVDTEREGKPIVSPDKKYSAFVKDNNLYVKDLNTGTEKALSSDGTQAEYYSVYPSWSLDSKKIAVMRIKGVDTPLLYLIESSPKDQLKPKVQTRDYFRPGDTLAFRTPVIFDVESGRQFVGSTDLCPSQFSLWGFEWINDSKSALFEYNERGHKVYRILEMSAETGAVRSVIEEKAEKYVNYSRYFKRLINNQHDIIWMSERDNWNHLYIYDRLTGKLKNQITKGEWYVREVVDVDDKKGEIIFSANGMVPNEDPYLIRYYKIRFDGTGLTCLTPETGMHKAWFSDDKKYLVDVYSMVDKAPVAVLRRAKDGKIIMPLEKADISALLKEGWKAPEVFVAKGRDGKTDIWGIIQRPTNFDPNKKYPVIEYIYSGPGSQYVPKTFIPYNRYLSAIAELGFIVVQMDGMSTSFRSKKFEEVCYKNLKDAGFPDRILWTKAACEKYPYMDIDGVGIFGASAGGQEAMAAVLFHPEHYKAAYAACGCHDNRMDKIWWNEQWMGYPVDSSYAASSNVVNAHLLTRPLMLVVGELDDNVDPASTYQVCNELIKAKKNFELIVLPGVGHTMGNEYGEHKRYDFFVKNLMHVEPPAWSEFETKK
ncbi:MAG: DPP IV N-terminal domain-containing protein [Paludibacter sp.]|nr:DPP IV N-terminal domain-containing protein [Paludibacter sp.]